MFLLAPRPHLCCREEVAQSALNTIRGVANHDRLDEELYGDFETEAAKKVGADFIRPLNLTKSLPFKPSYRPRRADSPSRHTVSEKGSQGGAGHKARGKGRSAGASSFVYRAAALSLAASSFRCTSAHSPVSAPTLLAPVAFLPATQKGDVAAAHEVKKIEQAARAAGAGRNKRLFYKITVKVLISVFSSPPCSRRPL
jgi:hypothetical protein